MAGALSQKIGLGIDFATFDRDLRAVANKIENAGKSASVKAGAAAGDVASGKLDAGNVTALVTNVGTRLATGIADGLRQASALMLGFTAHVDKMLNRLVGSAITIFRRIDSAMKFPAFDNFFKTAQLRFTNFSAMWRKPLSDMDIALAGGFGGTIQKVAKVLKALFDNLATTIATALKNAVASVAAEFAKVNANVGNTNASAQGLMGTMQKTAAAMATARFPKFAPMAPPGTGGRQMPGVGRSLGGNTNFNTPIPKMPPINTRWQEFAKNLRTDMEVAFKASGDTAIGFAAVLSKVGAALVSVPLRAYVAFSRLTNFLGSLGDVGRQSFTKIYEQHGILVGSILAGVKAVGALTNAMIRIGTLGVFGKASNDVQRLGKSAVGATSSVAKLGGAFKSVGRQILAAFGVVGIIYKTVQFLKNSVVSASDLNETMSRTKVVFGEAFGPVEAQAKKLNRAFGISREAQMDVASGYGAMAQGAGMSEAASASLANQLTQMAADLSSSVNIPFEEAGQKIRSALAGESEPLRQFGANISDTEVKAYALANGLAKAGGEISNQSKMTARAALIMRGLSYAQGDLERTSDAAANQFRKAGGGIQEFGVQLGTIMLPAIRTGTEAFNTLLGAILDTFEGSMPVIQKWMESVSGAMETVGVMARNQGSMWKISQLRVGEFVINTIEWLKTIPANFGPIMSWLGRNWQNLFIDFAEIMEKGFLNLLDNAYRFGEALWNALQGQPWEFTWTPLLDGFKAVTEALPELIKPALISVDDAVNEIVSDVTKKEVARAEALAQKKAPAPKKPGPVTDKEKTPEYKLASAVEIGSKEAYSIIAKSLAPGTRDPAREGVKVAKDGNAILKEIAANTRNGKPQLAVK